VPRCDGGHARSGKVAAKVLLGVAGWECCIKHCVGQGAAGGLVAPRDNNPGGASGPTTGPPPEHELEPNVTFVEESALPHRSPNGLSYAG